MPSTFQSKLPDLGTRIFTDMSALAQFKKDFPAYLDADDFELS